MYPASWMPGQKHLYDLERGFAKRRKSDIGPGSCQAFGYAKTVLTLLFIFQNPLKTCNLLVMNGLCF